jgi:hypothetical protein
LQLTDEQLQNLTLLEIEKILELNNRSLHDYKSMPYPQDYVTADLGNRLIYDEHNYDVESLRAEFLELFNLLTGSAFLLNSHKFILLYLHITPNLTQ